MKRSTSAKVCWLIVPVLFASTLALGQTTTTTTTPTTPQDSLVGGSTAPATPGSWLETAIATHRTRMAVVTNPEGGTTAPVDTSPDRHTLILTDVLTSLFKTLQSLADALLLAAQASGTAATTTTTTGS
jgi:hypothetical protein